MVVGGGQSVRERYGDVEEFGKLETAVRDRTLETLPLDQLHGQEVETVGLLDRVDRDDVRMPQGGHRAGLALEALQSLGVRGDFPRQDLQCDRATEIEIFGPEDLTHPALAQLGGDLEVGKRLSDQLDFHDSEQ